MGGGPGREREDTDADRADHAQDPAGSSQGRQLRIKGRGIPASEPGDLYAVLKIVLPPADTDEARKAYEEMAQRLPFDPRAGFGASQP